MVCGQQENEGFCVLLVWCESCTLGGLEKNIILKFQRYVILNAKRQLTGSLKVTTDLCQGSYRFRTRLPAMHD